MTINEDIKTILRESNIPAKEAFPVLLATYFGFNLPEYVPQELKEKLLNTGILDFDKTGVNWKVPLFEGQETKFAWVSEKWMPLFAAVNKNRKGVKSTVIKRMKKFFADNPEYRRDDVMDATRMYIATVEEATYLKTSHKFIMEGVGANKVSLLLDWCEKLEVARNSSTVRKGLNNTMR